jgi:hypothetical protein
MISFTVLARSGFAVGVHSCSVGPVKF